MVCKSHFDFSPPNVTLDFSAEIAFIQSVFLYAKWAKAKCWSDKSFRNIPYSHKEMLKP